MSRSAPDWYIARHDKGLTDMMDSVHLILLFLALGIIAFLYSSVGHAGASGYIAVMTLWGLAPTVIRPTALVLNILVACIGSFQFWRAGHFSWRLFWPFALLSIPAAYFGGHLQPSASVWRILIGLVLLFSAVRLISRRSDPPNIAPPSRDRRGSGPRISVGPHRHWRWNLSHAALAVLSMGAHPPGRRGFGIVYSGELNCGTGRLLYGETFHPVVRRFSRRRRGDRRCVRFASRQPTLSGAHDFAIAGGSSYHRRHEISSYRVTI